METRVIEIKNEMGATTASIESVKDGQTKRRERRAKERKLKRF
jgi:hypothetical protein